MVSTDGGRAACSRAGLSVHLNSERSSSYRMSVFAQFWQVMRCIPATVQTPVVDLGERPQNMSAELKLAMGLLSMTVRVHVVA